MHARLGSADGRAYWLHFCAVAWEAEVIGLMMLAAAVQPITGDAALQRRIDRAPRAVHALIERRAGCNYFASEYPYDEERARDLASKAQSLRCAALERDERALRRTYAQRPDILNLLASTRDVIY